MESVKGEKNYMSLNNEQEQSTKGTEKLNREKSAAKEAKSPKERIRVRLIPIWLRIIIVIVLLAICIIGGAAFGYGVIGEGNATDIFKKETWSHIIDLVKKQ